MVGRSACTALAPMRRDAVGLLHDKPRDALREEQPRITIGSQDNTAQRLRVRKRFARVQPSSHQSHKNHRTTMTHAKNTPNTTEIRTTGSGDESDGDGYINTLAEVLCESYMADIVVAGLTQKLTQPPPPPPPPPPKRNAANQMSNVTLRGRPLSFPPLGHHRPPQTPCPQSHSAPRSRRA